MANNSQDNQKPGQIPDSVKRQADAAAFSNRRYVPVFDETSGNFYLVEAQSSNNRDSSTPEGITVTFGNDQSLFIPRRFDPRGKLISVGGSAPNMPEGFDAIGGSGYAGYQISQGSNGYQAFQQMISAMIDQGYAPLVMRNGEITAQTFETQLMADPARGERSAPVIRGTYPPMMMTYGPQGFRAASFQEGQNAPAVGGGFKGTYDDYQRVSQGFKGRPFVDSYAVQDTGTGYTMGFDVPKNVPQSNQFTTTFVDGMPAPTGLSPRESMQYRYRDMGQFDPRFGQNAYQEQQLSWARGNISENSMGPSPAEKSLKARHWDPLYRAAGSAGLALVGFEVYDLGVPQGLSPAEQQRMLIFKNALSNAYARQGIPTVYDAAAIGSMTRKEDFRAVVTNFNLGKPYQQQQLQGYYTPQASLPQMYRPFGQGKA